MARVLKESLRRNDIIARFGGEEFIALLPNTNKKEAIEVANSLNQRISGSAFSQSELPLTITLGVAESDNSKENDSTLKMIKRADKALYKGKENGRNQAVMSTQ